jgi:deoxyribodipyrimidine photo-lyase
VKARVPWRKPRNVETLSSSDDFTAVWPLARSVSPIGSCRGGPRRALTILGEFVKHGLRNYPKDRNHPELSGTSRLSPYLHFGHIGPITIALAVQSAAAPAAVKHAFLEQLIVRRELSVNFVRYDSNYDSWKSREPWADRSLTQHAGDRRPILYREDQLEHAETHDVLWNAAQKEMVFTGWMHNYMRMYWAKKILEWSPSTAIAYQRAVWLGDPSDSSPSPTRKCVRSPDRRKKQRRQ